MLRLPKIIIKTLSVRLSLMVVFAMSILLMVSMAVMLHYSRKTVKEEALQKASQTLEGTVQCIDNILLSVEQSAGNFYYSLIPYLDQPDMMFTFSRKLVETNPYIEGCAIAFKPDFYKGRKLFMAYVYRPSPSSPLVVSETYANSPYTEQDWFTVPMKSEKPGWMKPLGDMKVDMEPIITFSLPIPGADGKPIGVLGVDVSLSELSQYVLENKPSANSYSTLLDDDGSYIVHPDSSKLFDKTVISQLEPSARKAAHAMLSGESGYMPFRLNGTNYFVFYKPFKRSSVAGRSMEALNWSAGIVYPEDDIFGDYNSLSYYVLAIAIVGMLLLFILCRIIIHRQLKPLLMLTESAQRIAKGQYNEVIPDSRQEDEIGRLQDNFQKMQQSLATHIGELEQLKDMLQERGKGLRAAYNEAQKANRLKTAFLHNMTNQMIGPADAIDQDVMELCNFGHNHDGQSSVDGCPLSASKLADDINQKGTTIAELLNNLINMSDEDIRKEVTRG